MTYQEIMSLRSAYNQGIRTVETRQACAEYVHIYNELKKDGKRIQELNPKFAKPLPYVEMMALRSAYNRGVRNEETRNATRLYAQLQRNKITIQDLTLSEAHRLALKAMKKQGVED